MTNSSRCNRKSAISSRIDPLPQRPAPGKPHALRQARQQIQAPGLVAASCCRSWAYPRPPPVRAWMGSKTLLHRAFRDVGGPAKAERGSPRCEAPDESFPIQP